MSHAILVPQLLPANQLEHFYLGGARIAALRGGPGGPYRPEEWIASTTTMAGQDEFGLSRLSSGVLLRDAIAVDPVGWLGPRHVRTYGTSTEILVKLLDGGQRLPVHVHPDRAFAAQHLGLPHGKTEAWIVLDADEDARVRIGFAETMQLARVRALVEAQDSQALVAALRSRPVRPGDRVLVPAGLPHCFDAGLLILELQEPTDLSVLLEWTGFAVDGNQYGHLGLGFETALRALRLDALDEAELDRLVLRAGQVADAGLTSLLPDAAGGYFRAHRVRATNPSTASGGTAANGGTAASGGSASAGGSASVEAGFAVVLVTAGAGHLVSGAGHPVGGAGGSCAAPVRLKVRRGDAVVVPWQAGEWHLECEPEGDPDSDLHRDRPGGVEAVLCRPPLPRTR